MAALLLVAATGAAAQHAASGTDDHSHAHGTQQLERHRQLVSEGEARLAGGDAAGAQLAFEAATQIVHAADVELGLVRSYMQAGSYRRALSFSAHAAGAHRELASGMALYAWLLYVGGQQAVAIRMLDDWITRAPGDAVLKEARAQLTTSAPHVGGVLAEPPWRMAPNDGAGNLPKSASAVGSGMLGRDGRSALVPTTAIDGARRLWVRNGLGQSIAASVKQRFDDLGLALLALDGALEPPAVLGIAPMPPFAGSPGSMVEFVTSEEAEPAWPLLRQGFFGRSREPTAPQDLGIDAPQGPRGGPVFDRSGRLAGVAISSADGIDRLVPMTQIRQHIPGFLIGDASPATNTTMPIDAIYETALRITLQVVTER